MPLVPRRRRNWSFLLKIENLNRNLKKRCKNLLLYLSFSGRAALPTPGSASPKPRQKCFIRTSLIFFRAARLCARDCCVIYQEFQCYSLETEYFRKILGFEGFEEVLSSFHQQREWFGRYYFGCRGKNKQ